MNILGKPVLGIETTGSVCSVCVYESEKKNLTISLNLDKAHSRKILSLIDFAVDSFNITPADLGGICVSEGPGSFTGLRLGFAAAKGIAYGAGIGIIKVPTFKSLAEELSMTMSPGSRGLIVTKAALEEYYVYGFEAHSGYFNELFELSLIENNVVNSLVSKWDFSKVFSNVKLDQIEIVEKTSPEALSVVRYAKRRTDFKFDYDVDFIEPRYFKNFIVKVK